jgi:hypothetical protein
MHDKRLASFFFGIRICQSDDGISIDQAAHATEVVASVLGKDWSTRLKAGLKHSIPLPAGSEHEAALVNETPFDAPSLAAAEFKCSFKHRSILCGFMHLGLWAWEFPIHHHFPNECLLNLSFRALLADLLSAFAPKFWLLGPLQQLICRCSVNCLKEEYVNSTFLGFL